jgi:hypothetical protein
MGFNISLIVKVSVEFILVLFYAAFVHVAIFINLCDLISFILPISVIINF